MDGRVAPPTFMLSSGQKLELSARQGLYHNQTATAVDAPGRGRNVPSRTTHMASLVWPVLNWPLRP